MEAELGKEALISGDVAEDGVLRSVQEATLEPVFHAKSTVNVDVIATADETWVRFDLGGFKGTTGCNFWGVVIPPS